MRMYSETNTTGFPLLAFDIYIDGTTMAMSGAQSLTLVRLRFVNLRGRCVEWHEVGICPVLSKTTNPPATKLAEQRLLLLHRFLYLMLREVIIASHAGHVSTITFSRYV